MSSMSLILIELCGRIKDYTERFIKSYRILRYRLQVAYCCFDSFIIEEISNSISKICGNIFVGAKGNRSIFV